MFQHSPHGAVTKQPDCSNSICMWISVIVHVQKHFPPLTNHSLYICLNKYLMIVPLFLAATTKTLLPNLTWTCEREISFLTLRYNEVPTCPVAIDARHLGVSQAEQAVEYYMNNSNSSVHIILQFWKYCNVRYENFHEVSATYIHYATLHHFVRVSLDEQRSATLLLAMFCTKLSCSRIVYML